MPENHPTPNNRESRHVGAMREDMERRVKAINQLLGNDLANPQVREHLQQEFDVARSIMNHEGIEALYAEFKERTKANGGETSS